MRARVVIDQHNTVAGGWVWLASATYHVCTDCMRVCTSNRVRNAQNTGTQCQWLCDLNLAHVVLNWAHSVLS